MASRLKTLQASVNPILSRFAVGYRNAEMIGRKICPLIPSLTESGTLYTFGKEGFRVYNTERALRAESKKINFAIGSDTYRCAEHALETQLDYKELDVAMKYGAERVLQLERRAINLVSNSLELELEYDISQIVFGASYYATGNKVTLTGNDQWKVSGGGEGSTSTPLADIDAGLDAARADMGVEPNTIVFGYDAWQAFKRHSDVQALLNTVRDKILSPMRAAELLEMENVYVGKGVYSSDGSTFADLWTDSVALLYVPSNPELVEGTTPHTVVIEEEGFPEVRTYDEKKVRSYEVTRKHVVKNVSTSYGYLIVDTCA